MPLEPHQLPARLVHPQLDDIFKRLLGLDDPANVQGISEPVLAILVEDVKLLALPRCEKTLLLEATSDEAAPAGVKQCLTLRKDELLVLAEIFLDQHVHDFESSQCMILLGHEIILQVDRVFVESRDLVDGVYQGASFFDLARQSLGGSDHSQLHLCLVGFSEKTQRLQLCCIEPEVSMCGGRY